MDVWDRVAAYCWTCPASCLFQSPANVLNFPIWRFGSDVNDVTLRKWRRQRDGGGFFLPGDTRHFEATSSSTFCVNIMWSSVFSCVIASLEKSLPVRWTVSPSISMLARYASPKFAWMTHLVAQWDEILIEVNTGQRPITVVEVRFSCLLIQYSKIIICCAVKKSFVLNWCKGIDNGASQLCQRQSDISS